MSSENYADKNISSCKSRLKRKIFGSFLLCVSWWKMEMRKKTKKSNFLKNMMREMWKAWWTETLLRYRKNPHIPSSVGDEIVSKLCCNGMWIMFARETSSGKILRISIEKLSLTYFLLKFACVTLSKFNFSHLISKSWLGSFSQTLAALTACESLLRDSKIVSKNDCDVMKARSFPQQRTTNTFMRRYVQSNQTTTRSNRKIYNWSGWRCCVPIFSCSLSYSSSICKTSLFLHENKHRHFPGRRNENEEAKISRTSEL